MPSQHISTACASSWTSCCGLTRHVSQVYRGTSFPVSGPELEKLLKTDVPAHHRYPFWTSEPGRAKWLMGRLCSQFHQSISDCQTYEWARQGQPSLRYQYWLGLQYFHHCICWGSRWIQCQHQATLLVPCLPVEKCLLLPKDCNWM